MLLHYLVKCFCSKICCVEALSEANHHIKTQLLKIQCVKYSANDFMIISFTDKKILVVATTKKPCNDASLSRALYWYREL